MTEEEPTVKDLEQLLRDERTLRVRAETRAADQAEKTQIWRTRAEERAERIERLLAEPRRSVRRRKPAPTSKPAPATPDPARQIIASPRHPKRMGGVRLATALDPEHQPLTAAFATMSLVGKPNALAEADLVAVDAASLAAMPAEAKNHFTVWLNSPARQPLALLVGSAGDSIPVETKLANVVFATTATAMTNLAAQGIEAIALNPVFDPAIVNPIGRIWSPQTAVEREERDGLSAVTKDGKLVGIESMPGRFAPKWLLEAAAAGVPLATEQLDFTVAANLARAGAAGRRWAYRHHTPTLRGLQIATAAGVDIHDPRPHAAAILVSMRPHQAVQALEMVSRQTYEPLSIVIGLHGAEPTPQLAEVIDRVAPHTPVTLLHLDAALTLGECLNQAIAATGAEVLAKIDDDDFYGPGHIEDGIQALEYSQAGIVGKGAQFTYLEEQDATVLRRPREEEALIGGSPTGATMFIRRTVWESVGFPHRPRQIDVLFTRAARENGVTVYANSRWEFCYMRQVAGHTWTTPSKTFTAGAEPQWTGLIPQQMVVPSLPAPVAQ